MDEALFTLTDDGESVATPCVEIVAFAYGVPENIGAGLARFLRVYMDAFGNQQRFYRTGDMKRFRANDAKAIEGPDHWFSDSGMLATKLLSHRAHSGKKAGQIQSPSIRMSLAGPLDPPRFVLRMALPARWGDQPDQVIALAQEALAEFPLSSGYAGYSLLWEDADSLVDREVLQWSIPLMLRYPGLGYGDALRMSNGAQHGVAAVNWLTFLGADAAAALGGLAALEQRAPARVSALALGKAGVILRAGDAPQIGDLNRQDTVPPYGAVGKLVAPVVAPDEALDQIYIKGMSEERAYDWLRRFFV
ncbi:type VI immunity family protein [Variovorax paradoxus]|uniref:type VI immunity family protein n=1 Tax=Variovorax paradoxus TaxID=34073 RepID=UPI003D6536DE